MAELTKEEKTDRARAAAAKKADNAAKAGLTRTVKLRIYPKSDQAKKVHQTIGAIRHVWNRIWLPTVEQLEAARWDHVNANGYDDDLPEDERKKLWKAAWKAYPDPNDTKLNKAYIAVRDNDPERVWLKQAIGTPITRASINCSDAIKASRGRTKSGAARKVRAGKIRPKSRRDDPSAGLEWQVQGKAPLGGKKIRELIDTAAGTVKLPSIGPVKYRDKGKQLQRYLKQGGEVCELTVKRDGKHFYACIAMRGLQPTERHLYEGQSIGLDLGVTVPIATSDGKKITSHQNKDIRAHLLRLTRLKRRVQRQCSRKEYAAAKAADALTDTGARKKGVKVPVSNRLRRSHERLRNIDRWIANYRADWQRNKALEIARANSLIAVEDLKVRNMTASAAGDAEKPGRNVRAKAALNREILARGFRSMRSRLESKAQELGGSVVDVDPAYTSQTCPECEHVSKENRPTQSRFECVKCGYKNNADTVGAINILKRGVSAGAQPASGRGGFAHGSSSQDGVAERAVEPSNKPLREPEASRKRPEGSRNAKPRRINKQLMREANRQEPPIERLEAPAGRGSRDDPD